MSRHLRRLAAPMSVGIVAVMSVGLADAFFLGRLGTTELAAISFTFPVTLTLSSLGIGLSAGAAAVTSQAIGRGDRDGTRRVATDSLLLAFLLIFAVAVAGYLVITPVFSLLGAEGETLAMIERYMRVWFFGLPFLALPMVASGLIRANGDGVMPSVILTVSAAANVGLDPVLIFGLGPLPALGVEGAAWATLAARGIGFVLALAVLIWRERLLTAARPSLSDLLASWRRVLAVGAPAAVSTTLNPFGILIVTGFVSRYGEGAVAAFGVGTRIEAFAAIPLLALSSAIGPVAGQNWGAGRRDRVRGAMRDSYVFSLGWAGLLVIAFLAAAGPIAGLFTEDEAVLRLARLYLLIVAATLAGYGVVVTGSAAFNATDRPLRGLGMVAMRSAVLYVPLAGLGVLMGPPWLVFAGIAVANVASGLAVWWWTLRPNREREGQSSGATQAAAS